MQLNEEVVKKSLDWLDSLVGNSYDSDIALATYQLLGILYYTCEETQKANRELGAHCTELCKDIERLSKSYTNLVPTLNEARADALNELKIRLAQAVGTYTKESYVYVSAWFKLIDQIIEDMNKESANDRSGQSTN